MMSFNPQDSSNDLESISPFSSLDSDINSIALNQKLSEEKEKSRKLEEKIAGYKTVVQQVPKFQHQIKELTLKNQHQSKQIALLEKAIEERSNKATSEVKEAEGLTDLANPVSGCSPANTRSPSFVILDHVKGTENESTFIVTEKQASPVNISSSILKYSSVTQESELPKSTQCQQENVHLNTKTVPYVLGKQDSLLLNTKIIPCVSSNQDIVNLTTVRSPEYYNPEHFVLSGAHHIFAPTQPALRTYSRLQPIIHRPDSVITLKMSHTTPPVKELARPPQTSDQLTTSYGIGAKPKEWTPISFSNQKKQHFDLEQVGTSERLNALVRMPDSPSAFQNGNDINSVASSALTHKMNGVNQSDIKTLQIPDRQFSEANSDLMKFSTVGFPPTDRNESTAVGYSDKASGVTFPSDDHHHLASQAESMAAILKSSHSPSGISEMLLEFSKEVGKLEAQLQEKQAQIQRQQVQMQSYAKSVIERDLLALKEENQTLREENENLFAFIMTHSENQGHVGPVKEFQWLAVTNQATSDMSRNIQPESPLVRKIETLEKINTKLFLANKDWYNKWELLRQSNHEKIDLLEGKIETLLKEKENLTEINESLQKQLNTEKANQEENHKKQLVLEGEKINLQKFVESLKKDVELLTSEKRKLNAELSTLRSSFKQRSKENAGNKALEGEIALLKQQLSVFAEDFEKERQDRAAAESKADKWRKEKERVKLSSENKIKQLNSQFKGLEDTLRNKNRQVADLQYQIDDLKLQLHSANRKAGFGPHHSYNIPHLPSSTYGPATHLFSNVGAESSLTGTAVPMISTSFQQQIDRPLKAGPGPPVGPEHLAGAWTCKECTYINYPSRSVCDICGYKNLANGENFTFETGGQELQSRGNRFLGFRDIEADGQKKTNCSSLS